MSPVALQPEGVLPFSVTWGVKDLLLSSTQLFTLSYQRYDSSVYHLPPVPALKLSAVQREFSCIECGISSTLKNGT